MEIDRAIRLACAALSDEDGTLSVAKAKELIREFAHLLAECPSCTGAGKIRVEVEAVHIGNPYNTRDIKVIPPGSSMSCPTCQGSRFDPDYVRWTCVAPFNPCRQGQPSDDEDHDECGCRVVLSADLDRDDGD